MSLLLAVAVAGGVAAGVFLDPLWLTPARSVVAACGLLAFLAAARARFVIARYLIAGAFAAISALLGADAQQRAIHPPLRGLLEAQFGGFAIESVETGRQDTPIEIEGRLLDDATITEAGANLRLRVERVRIDSCFEPARGGVSITVAGALAAESAGKWRAGRVIRAPAVLRRPARYLNEGVPDQELLLARRSIALVGSVKSAALVEVVAAGPWWDEAASSLRTAVRRALQRHVGARDAQSAAVAIAILIGDRGALDRDVEQRLQEAGTYHVIAISGGNIAILTALILAALWLLGIRGGWAALAAVILLTAYAHVAGGGSSVSRATAMAAIYLVLRMIDQRTAPKHAMAVTAAALLVVAPLSIADVGLWLTFGATAAIVAGATRVSLPQSVWLNAPMALLLASVCAEAVLMPIVAYVFQRVTIAGLAVNLVAVPCMAIVQVAAMVTAAADAIGWRAVADAAGWVTHAGVRGLIDSAALVDVAPWLTWRVPSPAIGVVAAYYLCLIVAVFYHEGHEGNHERHEAASLGRPRNNLRALRGYSSCSSWCALGLFIWIAIAPPTLARQRGDGRLRLTMMDVGQGDAMLVTLPNGRTLMVDTGGVSIRGDFDIGDRVIGPALRARGIGRLDYLAVTHGDPDHIGGAVSLVRDFSPAEVWDGVFVNNHQPTQELRVVAHRRRSAWRTLQQGDRLDLGGVELRVHHPPLPDWERQRVRNDDSLVIELRYGQVSMLLTGDIGREVEEALLPRLDLLPIVVLKSPHHGSGTSSSPEFIDAVKPRLVVIGVGRANPYGHPVPHVLARYTGADVLRTDIHGQIEIVTDGAALGWRTFTGRTRAGH